MSLEYTYTLHNIGNYTEAVFEFDPRLPALSGFLGSDADMFMSTASVHDLTQAPEYEWSGNAWSVCIKGDEVTVECLFDELPARDTLSRKDFTAILAGRTRIKHEIQQKSADKALRS